VAVTRQNLLGEFLRAQRERMSAEQLPGLARPGNESGSYRRSPGAASEQLQTLLDQWPVTPAWVSDRCTNVVAANALATELNPSFRPGCNSLRELLLQEEAKQLDFLSESMTVNDTDGYIMTLYYAEPGSETARKVADLQEAMRALA
jgi:hypothetical protein